MQSPPRSHGVRRQSPTGSSDTGSRPPAARSMGPSQRLTATLWPCSSTVDSRFQRSRRPSAAHHLRYWLGRYSLETRQSRNRASARAAFREGQRIVELNCRRHGETDHVLEGRGSYRCTRCRAAQVAEHRRRVKRLLIGEAGGSCRLCGYARCEAALEFHHLDPKRKEFHLSVRGITRSISALRVEAAKCVLLCATCHAEVEAGVATVELPTPRGGFEPPRLH